MLYELSTLSDIVLSLALVTLALVVFIRLVHDYRLVYTIGNLCRKTYKIEYGPIVIIPLNLQALCRNVELVHAESPHAESTRILDDHIELIGVTPDISRGEIDLYVYVRIYGVLDAYKVVRKVKLQLR